MGRPFAWLRTLLLLRAVTFADERCPMNVSQPAPENAYLVNDVLWAGQPEKPYTRAAYRSVPGVGFVLCTCEIGPCVRKCCAPNAAYVNSKCTPLNASDEIAKFEVGRCTVIGCNPNNYFTRDDQIRFLFWGRIILYYWVWVLPELYYFFLLLN